MPLVEWDGVLLAAAVWGLALAALLPLIPLPARAVPRALLVARALAIASSLAIAALGTLGLAGREIAPLEWWPGLPGDPFAIAVDALTAPFWLLLGLVAAASFAAELGTGRAAPGDRARAALHAGFVLALAAAFGARHALLFLLAWEGMTLLSAALVASDVKSARARTACYIYLAISHVGAAFLAFGLLRLSALAGSYRFDDLATALALLPARDAHAIGWLVTLGAAVKLGLVPVHLWLPLAHPEAPAPVSAVLSGAMVKAGLYALLRFAWQMPGMPPPGWGLTLLAAGAVTTLVGALYAVVEADAKRLLAFSTVKHAGLLAMCLGLAATFATHGRLPLAGLALAACLYHAVGHGLAKGTAFLAVGEAVHAAGTRDLEHLGGLARRLPRISVAALVAVVALCGVPLLSCFAGEWLLFQAMILGYSADAGGHLRLFVPFAGAGLALATALALAALVKLYGIGFLGRPRSDGAAAAHPAPPAAEAAMLALAALVAAWGIASPAAIAALGRPVEALIGPVFDTGTLARGGGLVLTATPESLTGISPLAVLALIAIAAGAAIAWATLRGFRGAIRRAPSWACGGALDARAQYSALGLTKPLRLIFEPVLKHEDELEVLEEGSPYFARRHLKRHAVTSWLEQRLLEPVLQTILWWSDQARRLQAGNLHLYLAYLLVAVVALLLFAR